MFLAPFAHLFSFLFLFSYHFPAEVRVNFAFLFFPLRGNRGRLPPSLLQILSTTWLDPFLGSTRNRFWEEWDDKNENKGAVWLNDEPCLSHEMTEAW